MDHNIAIIGYSGHAYVVIDAAYRQGLHVNYYCERFEEQHNPFQLTYLGNEGSEHFDWRRVKEFVLGIGDNKIRNKVAQFIRSNKKQIRNVVHPSAIISEWTSLGEGNFIAANVTINAMAKIGNDCIVNTGSIVEHDCKIGNAVHIAPGAVLVGNVSVGELSFIGANAVIKQGVKIGNNVVVGAGSVVLRDIEDNEIWAGNPAKRIK